MKTTLKLLFSFIAFWSLSACSDDSVFINPTPQGQTAVQFSQSQFILAESSGLSEISLALNKPAPLTGTVSIQVTTSHAGAFTTEPAIVDGFIQLPVIIGQSTAKIKITPANNSIMDGDKTVLFTITQTSDGFKKGGTDKTDLIIVDDEAPSIINFVGSHATLKENDAQGLQAMLNFSTLTPAEGKIELDIESQNAQYGVHFTTIPEAVNNKITFQVELGASHAFLTILPVNNSLINGDKLIVFKISATQGGVQKGAAGGYAVTLLDDELEGLPKSYETIAGDIVKKELVYDEQGRIDQVKWETYTPFYRGGTDKYHYNEAGQLTRINKYQNGEFAIDVYYTWANGRIVKSEEIHNGVKTKYSEYHYDEEGNVSATAFYNRQSNGTYKLWLVIDYMYFLDGNLYKSISSAPTDDGEFITLSVKTYDGYVNGTNPFPMVEILPTVNPMKKLPTYYRVEEHGHDFIYQISYEFREDGMPSKRFATSGGSTQTTKYEYY